MLFFIESNMAKFPKVLAFGGGVSENIRGAGNHKGVRPISHENASPAFGRTISHISELSGAK